MRMYTRFCCLLLCLLCGCTSKDAASSASSSASASPVAEAQGYVVEQTVMLPTDIQCAHWAESGNNQGLWLCETGAQLSVLRPGAEALEYLPTPCAPGETLCDVLPDDTGGVWALCAGEADSKLRHVRLVSGSWETDWERDLDLPISGRYAMAAIDGWLCVASGGTGSDVIVCDTNGTVQFALQDEGRLRTAISTGDGQLCVAVSRGGGENWTLLQIDCAHHSWGTATDLGTTKALACGDDRALYYLYDSSTLYACSAAGRSAVLDPATLGLGAGELYIAPYLDGFVIVSQMFRQSGSGDYMASFVVPGTDTRQVLTLRSLQPDTALLEAVASFNRKNSAYRVELQSDFSFYEDVSDTDWERALLAFHTEMISGHTPDLLDLRHMDISMYLRQGILADLRPLLQVEETDFLPGVFDALSIDGKLPCVTNSVTFATVLADARTLSETAPWGLDDLETLLDTYGTQAIGQASATWLLRRMVSGTPAFVDTQAGTCDLDSAGFIQLLKLSRRIAQAEPVIDYTETAVKACCVAITSFPDMAQYNALYAGQVSLMGFPRDAGGSFHEIVPTTLVGLVDQSAHRDGAIAFVQSLLGEEQQDAAFFFPIRLSSLQKLEDAALQDEDSVWSFLYGQPLTRSDIDLTWRLLQKPWVCSYDAGVIDLIVEGSGDYLDGTASAESVAARLQGQVRLYLSERS